MSIPELNEDLRERLGRRFGRAVVDEWCDGVPRLLSELAVRWELTFDSVVQRGSISAVIRCSAAGRRTVLKLSPARERIVAEAAGLLAWAQSSRVPAVLAVEQDVGALLIEAIEPGTPVEETAGSPSAASVGGLIASLHAAGDPGATYPAVSDHITHLFQSSKKLYDFKPDLVKLITPELYDRSYLLAMRLAADRVSPSLLHGDLTPANVLDGGPGAGTRRNRPRSMCRRPRF